MFRDEFRQPVCELIAHPAECGEPFFVGSLDCRWIIERPMEVPGSAWEHRAQFLRVIANGDHIIKLGPFSWERGKSESTTVPGPGFRRVYAITATDQDSRSGNRTKAFYKFSADGRDRNGALIKPAAPEQEAEHQSPTPTQVLSNALDNFGRLQQAREASRTAGAPVTVTLSNGRKCVVNANPPPGAQQTVRY